MTKKFWLAGTQIPKIPRHMMRSVCLLLFVVHSITYAGENVWTSRGPYGAGGGNSVVDLQEVAPNTIFVSTFRGAFKSVNGGSSWRRLNLPANELLFRAVPGTTDVYAVGFATFLFAAAVVVYRSHDLGSSWETISETIVSPFQRHWFLTDVLVDPQNPQVIYAAYYGRGVHKSTDGGRTWKASNTGLPIGLRATDLEFAGNGRSIFLLMTDGKVFKSSTGGDTWVSSSNGLPGGGSRVLRVDSNNPNVLFIAGSYGVFFSVDAGQKWKSYGCGSDVQDLHLVQNGSSRQVYVLEYSRLLRSSSSKSCVDLAAPYHGELFSLVRTLVSKPSTILVAGGDGILKSVTSGQGWKTSNQGLANEDVYTVSTTASAPIRLAALPIEHHLYIASSTGPWKVALRPYEPEIHPVSMSLLCAKYHPNDPNKIVALSSEGYAWISNDSGSHWRLSHPNLVVSFGIDNSIAFNASDSRTIYLAQGKSLDDGATWTRYKGGFVRNFTVIASDQRDGKRLYAGSRDGSVYESEDGGTNWRLLHAGFSDVDSIAVHPRNSRILYVLTSEGIYKSTNQGASWSLSSKGLPTDTTVYSFSISSANPQVLYCTTGLTLFISTDGASNWKPLTVNGIPSGTGIRYLTGDPLTPAKIYAATTRGVYEILLASN